MELSNVSYFIGIILPPLIDLINRKIDNEMARYWVSIVICLLIATVLNISEILGGNYTDFLTKAGLIFAQAQIVYKTYWKKSTAREDLYGDLKSR